MPAHPSDSAAPAAGPSPAGGKKLSLSGRLYRGQLSFDFIRHRRRWYALSAVFLLLAVGGVAVRGLNRSVDFTGGNVFQVVVPAGQNPTSGTITTAVEKLGVAGAEQPVVTLLNGRVHQVRVQTGQTSGAGLEKIQQVVADQVHSTVGKVSVQSIGSSWGSEITRKALISLIVFLGLVMVYLALAFEPKMGIAAILSLLHDLVITVGIYALVGFEISPATVIGVLTILGYSLYDTVVVFDKVRENTRGIAGGSRVTYSEAANLALNQTLVRSLNTTVIALLPILSILLIGEAVLGPGVLEDLALALAIGIAVGAYSSLFIATPVLAQLHEREPAMRALASRVASARAGSAPGSAPGGVPVAARTVLAGGGLAAGPTGVVAPPVAGPPGAPGPAGSGVTGGGRSPGPVARGGRAPVPRPPGGPRPPRRPAAGGDNRPGRSGRDGGAA